MKKLRIMVDTNILISASVFHSRIINQILVYIDAFHRLVISSYVMDEIYSVVNRKFPDKLSGIEEFLSDISYEYVNTPKIFDRDDLYIRDVKDYPVLYTAVTEDIDILITGDKDFADLDVEKPEILTPSAFMEKYIK